MLESKKWCKRAEAYNPQRDPKVDQSVIQKKVVMVNETLKEGWQCSWPQG
jgi:hypothetical protein